MLSPVTFSRLILVALTLSPLAVLDLAARPNFAQEIERPLRYTPEGKAFVIHNGPEFFNRPLYGPNTPFRVDAGDRPEFAFYLPGRGGNLRLGLKSGNQVKWLFDAASIEARYEDGAMDYVIRDEMLDDQVLRIGIVTTPADGVAIRVERGGEGGPGSLELIAAYGGVTGKRARRDGDIGTEAVPVSKFFQVSVETCRDNRVEVNGAYSTVANGVVRVAQIWPTGATIAPADAGAWASPEALFTSARSDPPFVVASAHMPLPSGKPLYLAVQRFVENLPSPVRLTPERLPEVYAEARQRARAVSRRMVVETPDPYVNAAVAALCVAADGTWDAKNAAFMHGAVAWRVPLLGWRGAYMGDTLGWPDRTARHLSRWFDSKTATPGVIMEGEAKPVAPTTASLHAFGDPAANLARNEPALHSEGDLTKSHYDMNMVAVDAFFRHLRWTGDVDFARRFWPVIERHFAWEQRLFRRPYGPDKLPLYEAYAAIWASDDLEYHGGGATHSSAYLYWQYKEAAAWAGRLGLDGQPYAREAELIRRGMKEYLWLPDRGWYAEWRDWLGRQEAHPDPAVWSFYHAVDSEAMTAKEAWQMTRFIDSNIAHIPLRGRGVPDEGAFTIPTSRWMPYTWSTNNVVMAEVAHTALGYWQSGRPEVAYPLLKGAILDSMFVGLCPGNVGMCTGFDMARGESQRDFADGCGMLARSLVEGLFGIQPNALAGELVIRPGFPEFWKQASLEHPRLSLSYSRQERTEIYRIKQPASDQPLGLRLRVPARADRVARLTINGKTAAWKSFEEAVGRPLIEIAAPSASAVEVAIEWSGREPETLPSGGIFAVDAAWTHNFKTAEILAVEDPQHALARVEAAGHRLTATVSDHLGHRTVFTWLRQGELTWWSPLTFEIRPPLEIVASESQPEDGVEIRLRNNLGRAVEGVISGSPDARSAPTFKASAQSESTSVTLHHGLLPGTNRVAVRSGNVSATTKAINWFLRANKETAWEPIDLSSQFNDRVTQIFKNEYLSPRSPFCSLAIPKQGIGSWCNFSRTAEIDDAGLRQKADAGQGTILLPQGIPFRTPGTGEAKNIIFTSQWDNYPHEVSVPLNGKASHVYLMMAGSTNWMQSRFENGEVVVHYTDGGTERLALENPTTWWPIDQDYLIDDYAFARPQPIPPRIDLATGKVRVLRINEVKGKGDTVPGGAATVLDLPLDPNKTLQSLTVRTLANEVVIGLMAVTLVRESAEKGSGMEMKN